MKRRSSSAMREAALVSQEDFAELGHEARESVSAHTLENGAARFANFARERSMVGVNKVQISRIQSSSFSLQFETKQAKLEL